MFALVGSVLLLAMGGLHLSGMAFVSEMVIASDAPALIKRIFPILFAHPSLQLFALGLFGIVGAITSKLSRQTAGLIGFLVVIDALLALYLETWIPMTLLIIASGCFMIAYQQGRAS